MTSSCGNAGVVKYEVRSTKYEVKKLGATELHGWKRRTQSGIYAWGINQSTREVEAPLVRRVLVTRVGIGMAAFFENFIGTGMSCSLAPHTSYLITYALYFLGQV